MWRHLWLMQPQRRYPRGSGTTRTARRDAGVAALWGEPGYRLGLDHGDDGTACEEFPDLL